MKMTINVPDELYRQVKNEGTLNASAVAQEAFRDELSRRGRLAKLDTGMDRIELTVERNGDSTDVAFDGRLLVESGDLPGMASRWTAYLTGRHRIAIYDENTQRLAEYDTFDELADEGEEGDEDPFVAAIAEALGRKHVVELDI